MSAELTEQEIESPCIRLCTLGQDDICVGCYRHINEITGWHSASNQMKQQILDLVAERKKHAHKNN